MPEKAGTSPQDAPAVTVELVYGTSLESERPSLITGKNAHTIILKTGSSRAFLKKMGVGLLVLVNRLDVLLTLIMSQHDPECQVCES